MRKTEGREQADQRSSSLEVKIWHEWCFITEGGFVKIKMWLFLQKQVEITCFMCAARSGWRISASVVWWDQKEMFLHLNAADLWSWLDVTGCFLPADPLWEDYHQDRIRADGLQLSSQNLHRFVFLRHENELPWSRAFFSLTSCFTQVCCDHSLFYILHVSVCLSHTSGSATARCCFWKSRNAQRSEARM